MSTGSNNPMEIGYRQPMSPGYRRPEPWVYTVAPLDRSNTKGLQHKPGTWAHFEITDQWRGDKQATNLELLQLAAQRIPGAGVLITKKEEYIGPEMAALNQQILTERKNDSNRVSYLHFAVVVFGASEDQFSEALTALHRDSQKIQIAKDISLLIEAYYQPEITL